MIEVVANIRMEGAKLVTGQNLKSGHKRKPSDAE